MKTALFTALLVALCVDAHALPVKWNLEDFRFSDGGTAYGSFTYDSETDQFTSIDIHTTDGPMMGGRHYVATAGAWGRLPAYGVLAFSDTAGPDFTGAGWFRIDARIDFNAPVGTIVDQWLAVGAESFCMNSFCSSAANELTHPGQSRDTISGHLIAAPVPEPSSILLSALGLALLVTRVSSTRREQ